jgi:hypothetical protein
VRRPGPTTQRAVVRPLDEDPVDVVRAECAASGCICGDALEVIPRALAQEELEGFLAEAGATVATSWEVRHIPSCPMLVRAAGVN